MFRVPVTAAALVVLVVGLARCGGPAVDRSLDSANELPMGHMDVPADGALVPPEVVVGGWAMDDRGVKEVRLFIDGHIVGVTTLNTSRPDVSKVFPAYAKNGDLHGFTTTVTFSRPGPHTILAQARDTVGATRDLGSANVTSAEK